MADRQATRSKPSIAAAAQRSIAADMRRLERVFSSREWRDRTALTRARRRARERAAAVIEADPVDPAAARLGLLLAASELLLAMSGELAGSPEQTAELMEELEDLISVAPAELALAVLGAPELLSLAPPVAIRRQLGALVAVAGLRGASLWTRGPGERIECACNVGEPPAARTARHLAAQVLAGHRPEPGGRGTLAVVPVGSSEQPLAALVGLCAAQGSGWRRHLMAQAAPRLAAALEREAMLMSGSEMQRSISESSERKLARLGFDLHDGPIQEIVLLADDLRLFRDQLAAQHGKGRERALLHGRFEDLEARLLSVDTELRRLSNEVNSASVLLSRPFDRALRDHVQAFAARTGVEPDLSISGPTSLLTASQQIALLNIAHESLNNIREHAEAESVQIEVAVGEHVSMRIADTGRGFDLERTMMRAARQGRVGLLGMHERVRLLGGQCRVESQSGGPTVVSIRLELWQPLLAGGDGRGSAL